VPPAKKTDSAPREALDQAPENRDVNGAKWLLVSAPGQKFKLFSRRSRN